MLQSKLKDTWWKSKCNVANCTGPNKSSILAWLSYKCSLKAERKKKNKHALFSKYHCLFLQSEQGGGRV